MYREHIIDPIVKIQMNNACQILHEWAKYKPAISGGCLWAWAANKPARDIDIFVKNSWGARKKAASYIYVPDEHNLKKKVFKHTYMSTIEEARIVKAKAYTTILPSECSLDIVLIGCPGIKAIEYFDYAHCMVAFTANTIALTGAEYYVSGTLEKRHKDARSEKVIMSKIQKSLWNTANAETMIKKVMYELQNIFTK